MFSRVVKRKTNDEEYHINRVELPREGGSNGEKKGEVRLQDRLQALRLAVIVKISGFGVSDTDCHWLSDNSS